VSTVRLQEELSYEDAVRTLGFEPGAAVSAHLPAFRQVEARLCELIDATPDEDRKARFREELARLNEALRVVEESRDREGPGRRRGGTARFLLSLAVVGGVVWAAHWANQRVLEEKVLHVERQIESLAVDGRIAMEMRRWAEAEKVYRRMLDLDPGSRRGREGLRSILEGREVERRQQIGFLVGTVQAAIEQRDWEAAESTVKELRDLEPDHPQVKEFLVRIEDGRRRDQITVLFENAEEALREERWDELVRRTAELESLAPDHGDLPRLKGLAAQGMRLMEERREKARQLYLVALRADHGAYSQEAMDALREAIRLAPQPEYQALYERLSSYVRTLEVPGEFATIGEALAAARPKDKVRVAEGVYKESLRFPVNVDIEGSGEEETIIECDAREASVLVVDAESSGSRVARFTLRQTGIDLTDERYPVVAVDGGELRLEDCVVEEGSGHGIAVVNGGVGELRSVRVRECGWDGLSVYGSGSRAVVTECRFDDNLHHGMDAWDGGSLRAVKSRCSGNGLTGAVLMSPGVESALTQCTLDRNREVGVLVSGGGSAELVSNRSCENLLGGFLIEGEGTEAALFGNIAENNQKAGIVVDRQSTLRRFEKNVSEGNSGEQVQLEADLPDPLITPPPSLPPPPKAQRVERP